MNKLVFESIDELREFMEKEVITTSEAIEIIGCSRQNLKQLVDYGTLKPFGRCFFLLHLLTIL
ncbi:hypothetical protein PJ311_11580 [Bacillus sp. CLL-7-23]|uniref:DNA-binding protein n=1 Tax=Bacillus changyiensis TaxID=3004103 RepID=A0ABT4X4R1_9BACI|nr:hypothetical protein [Bacillus changyiensis]MDA7027249.1 hypothetical protein [Bacillus changyiensis]